MLIGPSPFRPKILPSKRRVSSFFYGLLELDCARPNPATFQVGLVSAQHRLSGSAEATVHNSANFRLPQLSNPIIRGLRLAIWHLGPCRMSRHQTRCPPRLRLKAPCRTNHGDLELNKPSNLFAQIVNFAMDADGCQWSQRQFSPF